jgi:hypothetical protein
MQCRRLANAMMYINVPEIGPGLEKGTKEGQPSRSKLEGDISVFLWWCKLPAVDHR